MNNLLTVEGMSGVFYEVNPKRLSRLLAMVKIQETICETSCSKSRTCQPGWICDDIKKRFLEID